MKSLEIVPPHLIPKGQNCSTDNLSELYKLGLSMQIICEKENGIGLSAVQVGIPLNFFIIKFKEDYRFFVNCEYFPLSEEKIKSIEGCLSLKNKAGQFRPFEVQRFANITVKGKELVSSPKLELVDLNITPEDFYKIIFQHEIQHQEGVLISDIGVEMFSY